MTAPVVTPGIEVEARPPRLLLRPRGLTAGAHRDLLASLGRSFPSVRWDQDAEAYCVPVAYRARLETWLARHFAPDSITWAAPRVAVNAAE